MNLLFILLKYRLLLETVRKKTYFNKKKKKEEEIIINVKGLIRLFYILIILFLFYPPGCQEGLTYDLCL